MWRHDQSSVKRFQNGSNLHMDVEYVDCVTKHINCKLWLYSSCEKPFSLCQNSLASRGELIVGVFLTNPTDMLALDRAWEVQ